MPDLSWLFELAKYVSAGIVGAVAKSFGDDKKRRSMRRRLYQEIGLNLFVLVGIVTRRPDMGGQEDVVARSSGTAFRFDYFEHAQADKTTFADLKEGYAVDMFYRELRRLTQFSASSYQANAVWNTVEASLYTRSFDGRRGNLDSRYILKVAPSFTHEDLRRLFSVKGGRPFAPQLERRLADYWEGLQRAAS